MSVLENFKNIVPHRATCPICNFYSSNLQRSPWREKKGGACRPPGRPGHPRLYKANPLLSSSFELKKSTKNPEKREG